MDVSALTGLNLTGLREAAGDWGWIAGKLSTSRESFDAAVARPLSAESKWSGDDAKEAARTCAGIQLDIDAVAIEAKAVRSFLEDVVDGTGDGYGFNLARLQQQAGELLQEAVGKGLAVGGDGTVRWVVARAPGPLSPDQQREQGEKQAECDRLTTQLQKVLRDAEILDDTLSRGLKVIFGDEDTFRNEHRNREVRDDADMGDSWTESKLGLVRGGLYARGWDDAANLLGHYLEGTGTPMEVDTNRMLSDMPAFQRDVDSTLASVKSRPDGPFTTQWQDSRPNIAEGDASLNWYYGLNNFEYRMVGHKQGDHVTYQVEVRKRYDWGAPSEHRRDLEKMGVHFEQAEIAELNKVGMAKDFDVHGRSTTRTG